MAIHHIKHWLSTNPGWLLVYDNVNSYEEIAPFLPESGGHVILTTRNRQWPDKFKILSIDVMSEDEALELMASLIQRNIKDDEIDKSKNLVKLLGYLPLALAQAGAYIHQNQISISEYLDLYKSHEAELLEDNSMPEGTDSVPVAITWNISFRELIKNSKMDNEPSVIPYLLTACAYLSPDKISKNLLFALLEEAYPNAISSKLVSELIGPLWRYSLINSTEPDISIHRLLQVVLRYKHKQALKTKNIDYPEFTFKWYSYCLRGYKEFQKIENKDIIARNCAAFNLEYHGCIWV